MTPLLDFIILCGLDFGGQVRQSYRQMLKIVAANKGENRELFKKGENTWILDQNSENPLFKHLVDNIYTKSPESYKTFHMSVSMDQQNWGGVSSQRFKLKD